MTELKQEHFEVIDRNKTENFLRYTIMIVMTTSSDVQDVFFIPREYETTDISLKLTDDTTKSEATNTSSTFSRAGDFLKAEVAFSNFVEDHFYTLKAVLTNGNVVYKDKVFVTNQTLDQVNNDLYNINKDQYVEKETSNNDYILL